MQLHYIDHFLTKHHHTNALHCTSKLKLKQDSYFTVMQLAIISTTTQRNTPQVKITAVPQCNSQCRGGNTSTATYRNADTVEYE